MRKLGKREITGGIVRQLADGTAGLVDADRAQPLALDDRRLRGVERDADAQRARAVQQLAGERDGELQLLVVADQGRSVLRSARSGRA
ncbi:MAG TPA: hypothetical protein VNT54_07620 [Solirubrobacteraceae bacterium]|nr:hypothetical protein [Solirubrobacteraceae bacterium]